MLSFFAPDVSGLGVFLLSKSPTIFNVFYEYLCVPGHPACDSSFLQVLFDGFELMITFYVFMVFIKYLLCVSFIIRSRNFRMQLQPSLPYRVRKSFHVLFATLYFWVRFCSCRALIGPRSLRIIFLSLFFRLQGSIHTATYELAALMTVL